MNTSPPQDMITRNGSYSFNLDKGTYTIIARYGVNTSNELLTMENVTISQDDHDYVIDLVLFPSSYFDDLALLNENSTPIISEPADTSSQSQGPEYIIMIAVAAAIVVVGGVAVFVYLKKRKKRASAVTKVQEQLPSGQQEALPESVTEPEKEAPLPPLQPSASNDVTLPEDLREVIRIIEKSRGRITQLDLRKALPYSEAKVSLMITDLENRGIVKKIKKGRGNVIILNKQANAGLETE